MYELQVSSFKHQSFRSAKSVSEVKICGSPSPVLRSEDPGYIDRKVHLLAQNGVALQLSTIDNEVK
jgi:hypothetical protein